MTETTDFRAQTSRKCGLCSHCIWPESFYAMDCIGSQWICTQEIHSTEPQVLNQMHLTLDIRLEMAVKGMRSNQHLWKAMRRSLMVRSTKT